VSAALSMVLAIEGVAVGAGLVSVVEGGGGLRELHVPTG